MPGGCVAVAGSGCMPTNRTAGQKPPTNRSGPISWSDPVDCSSWSEYGRAPGTYSHFRHLVLAAAGFWGGKRGVHGPSELCLEIPQAQPFQCVFCFDALQAALLRLVSLPIRHRNNPVFRGQ